MNRLSFRAGGQAGFTLLEVLIALTLLGLIMTAVFSSLRFGARAWDAAENRVQTAGQRSLVQNFIRRQLQQARPLMWPGDTNKQFIAFMGESARLSFVAPLPAHRGRGGLYLFTLAMMEDQGQGQLVLSYRLFHPDTLEDSPDDEKNRDVMLEGVENIAFEYFGAEEGEERPRWRDSWQEQPKLPLLIRLDVEMEQEEVMAWPELVVAPRVVRSASGRGRSGLTPGSF